MAYSMDGIFRTGFCIVFAPVFAAHIFCAGFFAARIFSFALGLTTGFLCGEVMPHARAFSGGIKSPGCAHRLLPTVEKTAFETICKNKASSGKAFLSFERKTRSLGVTLLNAVARAVF